MGACPGKSTLEQLAQGELSGSRLAEVEAHVETCRRCAETLAGLKVGDDLIARVRELEAAREAIAPAMTLLPEIERHLTTTLFRQ